uniref:Nucleotidyltransferase domain-containing protein n=1 Tax=Ignavibacterium album TaxID=591197 RepID=A0A832DHI8_9BACT
METIVNTHKIEYSEIIKRILREVEAEKIILFGSRARGDNKPDSDLDLLIIVKDDFSKNNSRWKHTFKIRKALKDFIIPKDILIFSQSEVEYWKDSLNHIIPTCLREGKVLYERS